MRMKKTVLHVIFLLSLSIFFCACHYADKVPKEIEKEILSTPVEEFIYQEEQDNRLVEKVDEPSNPEEEHLILGADENKESEEGAATEENHFICTLSVKCDALLSNLDKLDESKYNLVPDNGVIFASNHVEFCEDENVFDVLLRELRKNNIHLEFEYTPAFKNYYIKGIGNIYEFDCGNTSGWMYKVNGTYASVGCSQYKIHPGDMIEWIYTCES